MNIEDGTHEFDPLPPNNVMCRVCCLRKSVSVHKVSEPQTNAELREGIVGKALTKVRHRNSVPESEPPARLYVGVWRSGTAADWVPSLRRAQPEDLEYVHLEPIRAALDGCEASINVGGINDGYDDVIVGKPQWEALVKSVKRENS